MLLPSLLYSTLYANCLHIMQFPHMLPSSLQDEGLPDGKCYAKNMFKCLEKSGSSPLGTALRKPPVEMNRCYMRMMMYFFTVLIIHFIETGKKSAM